MLSFMNLLFILLVVCITTLSTLHEHKAAKTYGKAAVAADDTRCSTVGTDILKQNGSAVDSYIATCLCLGVVNPMSSGIGGGGYAIVYDRALKKHFVYDYRGTAPQRVNESFSDGEFGKFKHGTKSTTVPSQLKGFWWMHQRHGRLPWKQLFEPAIKVAEEGVLITKPVQSAIFYFIYKSRRMKLHSGIKGYLTSENGEFLTLNDTLNNTKLIETFRNIQEHNITDFYEGELANQTIKDLTEEYDIMTLSDFKNYQPIIREGVQLPIQNGLILTTTPAPTGGPCLVLIANIMSGYNFTHLNISKIDDAFVFYQTFVEAVKFSLAERGLLADPDYGTNGEIAKELTNYAKNLTVGEELRKKIKINETYGPHHYGENWAKDDEGTSHVSILAENGDAVSGTNSINFFFGSLYRSQNTGIIFNNNMNDFSIKGSKGMYGVPYSPMNRISPGKRPATSMAPAILTDSNGDVKMVIGASGGPRILMAVIEVILKTLYLNIELGEAISSYRVYHTGPPKNSVSDYSKYPMPDELRNRFRSIGHKYLVGLGKSVVQAILRKDDNIYAMSDPRKHAEADGY